MKKRYWIIIFFSIFFILNSCFLGKREEVVSDKRIIRIAFFGNLLHRNPHFATDLSSTFLLYPLYHSLFTYDESGKIVKDLVKEYFWKNHLTLILKIRKSFHYTDGERITEKQVMENLKYFSNPQRNFPFSSEYGFIKKIKVYGNSIIINLKYPFSPVLSYLTIPIVQEKFLGDDSKFPFSSKGFEILSYKRGRSFTIKKKEKLIKFIFVKDKMTALLKLKKGEVDLIAGYKFRQRINDSNILQKRYKINMLYYLVFNLKDKRLRDIFLRKKIKECLDFSAIVEAFKGDVYYSEYPVLISGFFEEGEYNVKEKGWKKFQQSVFNGPPFSILINSESGVKRLYATIIKEQLKTCGIEVKIISLEYASYLKRLKGGAFEMAIGGYVFDSDPNQRDIWHSKGAVNYAGLDDESVNLLIEKGIKEINFSVRKKIYTTLYSKLMKKIPLIFLPTPYFKVYYRKNLKIRIPSLLHSNSSLFQYIDNWEKF